MQSDHIKAAIIGYWRMGATLDQICAMTGVVFWKIEKIIEDFNQSQLSKNDD